MEASGGRRDNYIEEVEYRSSNMSTLKSFLKRNSFINAASEVRWKRQAGLSPIWLDFPVKPVSRYGYTRAPIKQIYELLDRRRESYKEVLASFLPFHDSFSRISVVSTSSPDEPFWVCGSFMGLEPLSLYCFLAQRNPRSYVEVGSGNSTKFARRPSVTTPCGREPLRLIRIPS